MRSNTRHLRPMGMTTPNSMIPGTNSTVERKHQSSVRKSMEERLGRVTAQVDSCRRSDGVPHLVDAKGQMAKMERANQIQKENNLLIKKLEGIRISQPRSNLRYCAKPGLLVQAGGAGPKIDMGNPVRRSSSGIKTSFLKQELQEDIMRRNIELKGKVASAKPVYSYNALKQDAEMQKLYLQKLRKRPPPAWGLHAEHPRPWDVHCGPTDAPHRPSNAESRRASTADDTALPGRIQSYSGPFPAMPHFARHRGASSADGSLPAPPAAFVDAQSRPAGRRMRFSNM